MSEILNTFEAAKILGIMPEAVRRMYRRGKLPSTKFNAKAIIFSREDVERAKKTLINKPAESATA
ncbi:MAG: helix-turn-helix domain-containing protein [Candidatus Riflebacteria bacterium]|nr:helix-turn-helix domain-containing protein [Candidatus Riflebacteria bacterium]